MTFTEAIAIPTSRNEGRERWVARKGSNLHFKCDANCYWHIRVNGETAQPVQNTKSRYTVA